MIRAPSRSLRRIRLLVFLCIVVSITILASFMFASYIDEAEASAMYLSLGFDHVFVISARPNIERRKLMSKLLRYQGIPYGFFPATMAYDIDHPEAYSYWLGETHWHSPTNYTLPAPVLAEFRTYMNVINDIIRLEHSSTLVLSDLVDITADIKQQMQAIIARMPATWEILYLGHCSISESSRPTTYHPRLFVATNPQCTFAYALSQAGARRLKRVLDNMWPYPPKSFEQVLSDMVKPLFLEAYSVDPPLAAPIKPVSETMFRPESSALSNSTLDRLGMLVR
ncbi:hypothetical protein LPJ78_000268 [Coemansia sp. RSA 989]|nr:hypothetical protein LPJ68_004208 [Coemansia sp. RSA 1086]KAJ1748896.1 hypothetical protein LPJ79_004181 [Coemansia sp. RSA 1821]KAJ1868330.1 hypothetical protein LPJ78_000268 [Coemansia sp. RSA 989]KAJ1875557.1 hypothetical protein LPJ55_000550 [Coemansia sp. RSA 990]KAJ2673159.1 hypothetical protein IWW42_002444 [Coemansia sp. RSA 1085]